MKTVLVVDDVPEVTTLLKAKIEHTGRFMVVSANGGREALRVAAEVKPDLIVCDIDMPGMDGSDLAAALSQKDGMKDTPFVFLSSLVTPSDMTVDLKSTRRPMLSKQAPIDMLIRVIEQMLAD